MAAVDEDMWTSFVQDRHLLQSTELEYDNSLNTTTVILPTNMSSCDHIDYNYDIAISVICAMCFIFGIIYTFFGYRFFKAIMFLTGFLFTSLIVYLVVTDYLELPIGANIGIALGVGLVCGIITMLVQYIGLFLTGFHLGISIALGILILLEQFYHPVTFWIPVGILLGVGTIFGLMTLKLQKAFTILGTSVFGGALMITCLDYFIEKFVIALYAWERVKGVKSYSVCWYSWIILSCWPFCFIVGSITQWQITGKGYNHREVLAGKKMKKVNFQKTRQKQKHDTAQSRYRHLYQARRVTGDVISSTYLQTMQQELSPSLKRQTIIPTESTPELESTNTTLTQIP